MPIGLKIDRPPLLAPGRHVMTLEQVWDLCVVPFHPDDQVRVNHYHRLEQLVQDLLMAEICCEVWLDGSMLTEKAEPSDLDVTVIVDQEVYDALTSEQNEILTKLRDGVYADGVDSFMFVRLRREHPHYGLVGIDPAFDWGEQYGRENGGQWTKGFAILRLRETDVGLLIHRR